MLDALRTETQTENEAIRQAALDYIEGWYTANAERMERALHPHLAKRIVFPATAVGGKDQLDQMTAMELIQRTKSGIGLTPEDKQQKEVTILDRYENAASVKIVAKSWIDYLHMAKFEGKWVIINVLWELKPRRG